MECVTKVNYVLGRVLDRVTYILGLPGYSIQKPALTRGEDLKRCYQILWCRTKDTKPLNYPSIFPGRAFGNTLTQSGNRFRIRTSNGFLVQIHYQSLYIENYFSIDSCYG